MLLRLINCRFIIIIIIIINITARAPSSVSDSNQRYDGTVLGIFSHTTPEDEM